jgi:hypothetical protein
MPMVIALVIGLGLPLLVGLLLLSKSFTPQPPKSSDSPPSWL